MPKIELTLGEDISNMQWVQKLLLWRSLLYSSTTNWKNNSSLVLRMMENGFYRLRCVLPLGADLAPKGEIGARKSTMKISVYLIKGPRSQPNFFPGSCSTSYWMRLLQYYACGSCCIFLKTFKGKNESEFFTKSLRNSDFLLKEIRSSKSWSSQKNLCDIKCWKLLLATGEKVWAHTRHA